MKILNSYILLVAVGISSGAMSAQAMGKPVPKDNVLEAVRTRILQTTPSTPGREQSLELNGQLASGQSCRVEVVGLKVSDPSVNVLIVIMNLKDSSGVNKEVGFSMDAQSKTETVQSFKNGNDLISVKVDDIETGSTVTHELLLVESNSGRLTALTLEDSKEEIYRCVF